MTDSFLRSAPALRDVLLAWKHAKSDDSREKQNSCDNATQLRPLNVEQFKSVAGRESG